MKQIARNAVDVDSGCLRPVRYLLHDRDAKFCASFKDILKSAGVTSEAHYHHERNHQGKANVLLFPKPRQTRVRKTVKCTQRLGGLLKYYEAA